MSVITKDLTSISLDKAESIITTSSPNSKANGGLKMPDFAQIGKREFWLGDYVSSPPLLSTTQKPGI